MKLDPSVFSRQFRFWTLHCLLNALPSLGIALGWMKLWKHPPAVVAMFAAIGTFILLYATLTTLAAPLHESGHILSRSLKLGTRIRAWISGISLLVVPTGIFVIYTPDYWCGAFAIALVNRSSAWVGWSQGPVFDWAGGSPGFLAVFSVTLLEGFLLSFLLLMFCFFTLLFLQARDRRRGVAVTLAEN